MTTLCTGQGDVSRWVHISSFTDICRYLQIFADICRYLQIFADICRYLQIFADLHVHESFTFILHESFPNPSRIFHESFTNPQIPENFTTLPSNHGDLRICKEICEDLPMDLNKMVLVPVWRYYRDLESLYTSYCEWIPNHGNIDNYGPNTGCYLTQPLD